MRINIDHKTMDMETRDINYILPAYVRSYRFHSKNEMPSRIIFPMFPSVKIDGVDVPIEYVPLIDPRAEDIAKDGSNVPEITEEQDAALDEKDEEIMRLKQEVASLTSPEPDPMDILRQQEEAALAAQEEAEEQKVDKDNEAPKADQPKSLHPARTAFQIDPDPTHQLPPDRVAKQAPGGDIGPGVSPDGMQHRDVRDQARTAHDLQDGPDVDDEKEKPYDKAISRGEDGRPVVEDKPNASS